MSLPQPTRAELNGERLYGDNFSITEIEQWFADEADAYVQMTGESIECGYVQWAVRYGFRRLPAGRRWKHVLAFGAARGTEVVPIADHADRITILESTTHYKPLSALAEKTTLLLAQASGNISLDDDSVDLIVCFGVLHHIPNVSHVLAEFSRVLAPGGYVVLREPIHSMGTDWSKPRTGLTPHERGIPLDLLQSMVRQAGLSVTSEKLIGFPPVGALWRYWKAPYNDPFLTRVDATVCRILRFNLKYRAETRWRKLRPTSVAMVLRG